MIGNHDVSFVLLNLFTAMYGDTPERANPQVEACPETSELMQPAKAPVEGYCHQPDDQCNRKEKYGREEYKTGEQDCNETVYKATH